MTKYESEETIKERNELAYKLVNDYGERAKNLCKHITGKNDLKAANIFLLWHIQSVLQTVDERLSNRA